MRDVIWLVSFISLEDKHANIIIMLAEKKNLHPVLNYVLMVSQAYLPGFCLLVTTATLVKLSHTVKFNTQEKKSGNNMYTDK